MRLLLAILMVASSVYGQVRRPASTCSDYQQLQCDMLEAMDGLRKGTNVGNFKNIVELLQPVKDSGGWFWNNYGKMERMPVGPMPETPWIYQNMDFQCVKWHEIFFNNVAQKSMVHSHCHECFKVVIAPRTVEELIALENWQKTLDVPCKCGIELRDFVSRLYGGYFYNRGVSDGKQAYGFVKRWAEEMHGMQNEVFEVHHDEPMPVILKLGCTEFERALGPSVNYKVTEDQLKLEADLDNVIEFDPFKIPEGFDHFPQPEVLKQYVRTIWLKWAHHHGDKTYIKFMPDGKPFDYAPEYFTPPPATYHGEEG